MAAQTSMLHIRIDDQLKAAASEKLATVGLTVSDAVRILLTRVVREGGLPVGLTMDEDAYDDWFKAKVQEALDDPRPRVSNEDVKAHFAARREALRKRAGAKA
ncbi:type II toxin-antitoxin system RelB/DinJ family antitoxin [Paraburkholderia silviterrae]|uniref:Type II toxin-antitoxin system RelB/DinJ family antitoxin n=1 Tax=Paraburkholderia silviterrae TaxID=2528715 RepID=A0A4R5MF77_9BURK|nr:type II toxin-antitoxin system RelB/DinJ family antitoxin [Paraburkholderia silviterrae]TDG25433.1 type II toxin-antitoxin system RelB/DinJ family antitoxin [Paraburkholderia silviterrae]